MASRTATNNNAPQAVALSTELLSVLSNDGHAFFSVPRSQVPVYGGSDAGKDSSSDCRTKVGALLRNCNIDNTTAIYTLLSDGATDTPEGDARVAEWLKDSIESMDEPSVPEYFPSIVMECNGSGWLTDAEQQDLTAHKRYTQCLPVRGYSSVLFIGDGSSAELGSSRVTVRWPNAKNSDGFSPSLVLQRLTQSGKFEVRGKSYNDESTNNGVFHGRESDAKALFEPDTSGVAELLERNLEPDVCNVPQGLQHATLSLLRKLRMHSYFAASQKTEARCAPPIVVDGLWLFPNLSDMDPEQRPARGNRNETVSVVISISRVTAQSICSQLGNESPLEGSGRVFIEIGCDGGPVFEDGRSARYERPTTIRGKVLPHLKSADERIHGICRQKPFIKVYAIHDDDATAPPRDGTRQSDAHWITGKPGAGDKSAVDPEQHDPSSSLNNTPDLKDEFFDYLSFVSLVGRKVCHSDARLAHFERLWIEARKANIAFHDRQRAEAARVSPAGKATSLCGYFSTPEDVASADVLAARHLKLHSYESSLKRKTADSPGFFNHLTKLTKRSGETMERRGSRSAPEYKVSRTHSHLFPAGRGTGARRQ